MASQFPRVPKVSGDTDDEVSIHLYNKVGPAKPLPHRNFDDEVLSILNEDEQDSRVAVELNKKYQLYQSTGKLEENDDELNSDEYDVETEVEDDEIEASAFKESIHRLRPKQDPIVPSIFEEFDNVKKSTSSESTSKSSSLTSIISSIKLGSGATLFTLWVTFVLLLIGYFVSSNYRELVSLPLPVSSESFAATFKSIASKLTYLELTTNKLSEKQATLESNQNLLAASLNNKFEVISTKFQEIESSLVDLRTFQVLYKEFDDMKTSVSSIIDNSDPDQLETKLNSVTKKLNELSDITSNIETIKKDILTNLLDLLPERIPIYIKDRKVHFIPEFQKFLYSFIEKYNQENPVLDEETKKKLQLAATTSNATLNKEKLETFLKSKLNENNKQMWDKLNGLLDNLSIASNSTDNKLFAKGANLLLLDNLLDIISKGSIKVNYADYNLGARILGFLTKLGGSESSSRLFSRRLFLGWYDYLTSPQNWNYNANNVLVDGGKSWECLSNRCSIGIRLFNPVIVTDIVIKSGTLDSSLSVPSEISLYIKPKTQDRVEDVLQALAAFSTDSSEVEGNENKYLKKFIKVKTFKLNPSKSMNHLKIPVNLINLKVPVRDIYMKLTCATGKNCAIFNTKVYGITEFNSYRYSDEVELMVDKLKLLQNESEDEDIDSYIYEEEFEDKGNVLGDDELLW